MKHRLRHETREETAESLSTDERHHTDTEEALAFETPEAMIRHDAAQTGLPAGLSERIARSVAQEAPPKNPIPWWKRWRRS